MEINRHTHGYPGYIVDKEWRNTRTKRQIKKWCQLVVIDSNPLILAWSPDRNPKLQPLVGEASHLGFPAVMASPKTYPSPEGLGTSHHGYQYRNGLMSLMTRMIWGTLIAGNLHFSATPNIIKRVRVGRKWSTAQRVKITCQHQPLCYMLFICGIFNLIPGSWSARTFFKPNRMFHPQHDPHHC